jgi:hypothetical protein
VNQSDEPIKEPAQGPEAPPPSPPEVDSGSASPPESPEPSHAASLEPAHAAEPKNVLDEAKKDLEKAREVFEEEEKEIESEEETDAAEVSQTLRRQTVPGVAFQEECVKEWCGQLQKDRLLILESWDPEVLYAAAQSIAFHSSWPAMDCRYVEVTDSSGALKLKSIAERGASPQKRERLIVVFEVMPQGTSILHSNRYSQPSLATFRELLGKRHIRLLIMVFSGLLQKLQPDYKANILFAECTREIDFLLPRLKALFGPKAGEYRKKILEEQRPEELWSGDDQKFQKELAEAIERKTLQAEIESSDERREQLKRQERIRQQEQINPVSSLPGMTPVERASIWLATFMPRLPVRDFEHAMQVLLEGPKPESPEHQAIWNDWKRDANQILEKCQMAIQEMPRQSPCIGFQRSALAAAYQRAFVEKLRFHHENFFERIERAHCLVSNRDSIRRTAAGLLVQRCLQEADDFTTSLLGRTIRLLAEPADIASTPDDLMERLPVDRRRPIRKALAYVLQRLGQEGGAEIATRMLLMLAGTGGPQTAFEIFKESRPEDFPSEQLLRMMLPFLQRGKDKLPERARQLLLKIASRNPDRTGEIFSLMRDIFPEAVAVEWLAYACERHIEGTRSREADPILCFVLGDDEQANSQLGSFFELLASKTFAGVITRREPFSSNPARLDVLSYWLFPYRELSRLELEPALVYLEAQLSARDVFWQRVRQLPLAYIPHQSDLFRTILGANWSYEAELAGKRNSAMQGFVDKIRRTHDGQLAGMRSAALILSEMLGEALATPFNSSDKAAYAVKTRMSERWKGLRRSLQAVREKLGDPRP